MMGMLPSAAEILLFSSLRVDNYDIIEKQLAYFFKLLGRRLIFCTNRYGDRFNIIYVELVYIFVA